MSTITYTEKYRPQFHFTPPSKWMNDPNGMVYFEGEYHLFYQHHPNGTTWGPMHWGHAISTDLIHWEHRPIALAPDHNGYIFSGSAVVDWKDSSGFFAGKAGLVAIFTHADQYPNSDRPRQRQSLAYSLDKGRTWTMYDGNPVLYSEEIIDFRDPKVFWYEPKQQWVMVLAAGDRVHIYTSANLKDWSFGSEFGSLDGSHDGVWECPDLIELPVNGDLKQTKWVLIVSIGDNPKFTEGSRTQYFTGSFDGYSFVNDSGPETVLWLDHGRDNYAGVTWSDINLSNQEKLFIGWMSNWKYANHTPTETWRSAMTIPRVLSLRENASGIRLMQKPVVELEKLRQRSTTYKNIAVVPGKNILSGIKGDIFELICEVDLASSTEFGFKLRMSDSEETVVGYNKVTGKFFVDRSNSGESDFHGEFPCMHEVQAHSPNGKLKLQIFVDHSSIEVFVNDGECVITDQIFPAPSSTDMDMFVIGGEAKVESLVIYSLNSIHGIYGI
ncbi:glycoside hydrolase family 32 protein [Paenibacillus sp. S-38]|uniref:glycoside hydrolase family 32 protein n=1 Tax=Paenibacillus sp. S-38 TaxID=3416710 RepID=UPI003CE9EFFF